MKHKNVVALILCICLLFALLAGCGANDDANDDINDGSNDDYRYDPEDDNGESNGNPSTPDAHIHGIDFDSAIETFPPDTVMIRAGDITFTWAQLYVFLFRTITDLMFAYGTDLDLSDNSETGESLADLILEYSTEEALSFMVYEYGASIMGLQLSDEDLAVFNSDLDSLLDMYGGKEILESSLRENSGFFDFDVFSDLYKIEFSVGLMINELYGENASLFPDDSVAAYALRNGYMMAMHILRLKDEDDDNNTALSEAEDILKQLNEKLGSDNFADLFKELMHEVSDDHGGLSSYPDGYLFLHHDMVPEFSNTTAGLEIGQMSDIVETVYGYHIILRIPLDYEAVPTGLSREGLFHTLRQLATLEVFSELQQVWRDSMSIEFMPEYHSIDLATIFKWHDDDCDY